MNSGPVSMCVITLIYVCTTSIYNVHTMVWSALKWKLVAEVYSGN